MWAKSQGGTVQDRGSSMAFDAKGNIFTTGTFKGTSDFDPDTGTVNKVSKSGSDIYISKFAANGKFLWVKSIEGGGGDDYVYSIQTDSSGNIYIAGSYTNYIDCDPDTGTYNLYSPKSGYTNIFILKLDNSGNFVWGRGMGGNDYSLASSIALDKSGSVLVSGYFQGTTDFDPDTSTYNLSASGSLDIFIAKLSGSGNFIWARAIGGAKEDYAVSLVTDTAKNVYIAGFWEGTADFDPSSGTAYLTPNGMSDMFIAKYNSSGNFKWVKSMGGRKFDYLQSMAIDANQNIYTTGWFQDTVDFDPGSGTSQKISAGFWDIFISKLDKNGNFVWVKTTGGKDGEYSYSITVDDSGNIYTVGNFFYVTDFDPGTGTYNLTSNGGYDVFIFKLNSIGNFKWAKSLGSNAYDYAKSVIVNDLGDVYTTGYYGQTVDFDPGAGTFNLTSNGQDDIFNLKLSPCNSPPANAGSINGQSTVCDGKDFSYSIGLVSGAVKYLWNIPSGSKIIKGQNTNTITIRFGSSSGKIIVTPINSCGTGRPDSLSITVNPTPTVSVSPGISVLCKGDSVLLTASGAISYSWQPAKWLNDTTGSKVFAKPLSSAVYIVTGTNAYKCSNAVKVSVSVNAIPKIIRQPVSQKVNVGYNSQFSISTAIQSAFYKWQQDSGAGFFDLINGTKYTGVNRDTLTTYDVKLSQNKMVFRCITGNGSCNDTSDYVRLLPQCILSFSKQPSNVNIAVGSSTKFNCLASSSSAIYQWQEDTGSGFLDLYEGGGYSGVNKEVLSLSSVKLSQNNHRFRCVISEEGCFDTSVVSIMKVHCILTFIQQPMSMSVSRDSSVVFTASSSDPGVAYQWQKEDGSGFADLINSANYSGVSEDSLKIRNVQVNESGNSYRCIISDGVCRDTSNAALLKVNCISSIKIQPVSQKAKAGTSVLFSLESSASNPTYQWQEDKGSGFADLSNAGFYTGAKTDSLWIAEVDFSLSGHKYRCNVDDKGCIDTSVTTSLKVDCFQSLNTQPSDNTTTIGKDALFFVSSLGSATAYQWQQDIGSGFLDLSNNGNYTGVTNDSLTISKVTLDQNTYKFRCILIDFGCLDTSNTAILLVKKTGFSGPQFPIGFKVYPNPSSQFINIEASHKLSSLPYYLTDQAGAKILAGHLNNQINVIDIYNLAPGFYFLIIGDLTKTVVKLIRQ